MKNPVSFINNQSGNDYRVVINAISSWEDFEKLVRYLEINYKAEILESYDGPDARHWIIKIDNEKIELIHNDGYGNYFRALTLQGLHLIKQIGEDLKKRLKTLED